MKRLRSDIGIGKQRKAFKELKSNLMGVNTNILNTPKIGVCCNSNYTIIHL